MDAGNGGFAQPAAGKNLRGRGATGSVVRTFLLHDCQFVGQKFHYEGFQAVLLAGKDETEFYDDAGELLKTVRLEETDKKVAA